MFVSNSMVKKVITIDEEASLFEAQETMASHNFRHLVVIDDDDFVKGIITDRDIRSAMPYSLLKDTGNNECIADLAKLKVGDVMTLNPTTISPMNTIQDALLMIKREKVGAFPVVDENGKLKGILSNQDLLSAFINVMGIGESGTLLGILVEEKVGQMKRIVDVITEENISIGSIMVARYGEKSQRAVFPYLLTNNVIQVKKKIKALGLTLIDPMDWYLDKLPSKA